MDTSVNLLSLQHFNNKFVSGITVSAIPGISGLKPILKLIRHSEKILLANKEAIICGWDLIKKKANRPALSLTSFGMGALTGMEPAAGDRRRSQGQRPLSVRQTVIPLRIPQGIH